MSDECGKKVTVFATHGPEDPERATLPFLMANAALVEGCESVVILQGPGVLLAKQGIVGHVFGATLPALSEQVASFLTWATSDEAAELMESRGFARPVTQAE